MLLVVGLVLACECVGLGLAQVGNCHTIDNCACVYDDGTIVNLTALARVDGKPK